MRDVDNITEFLHSQFANRLARNPAYSLRSFARDLEVSPGLLSLWLKGKKGVSAKSANSLAEKLGLSASEKEKLLLLADASSARNPIRRKMAEAAVRANKALMLEENLSLDVFQTISEWQHFAILELASLPQFRAQPEWIAERLNISKPEAELSLARLKKIGLIIEKDGYWQSSQEQSISPSGIPSDAIRKHHRQILKKADDALEFIALEKRDFSSTMFCFSVEDMEEARKALKDFRRTFAERFGKNVSSAHRVYALGVQFFPVDQGERG